MIDSGLSGLFTGAFLTLFVAAACCFDLKKHSIPNWLTTGGLGVALVLRTADGVDALAVAIATATLVLLLALPLFAFGGFGGGDVKFLVAVSAYLVPAQVVETLLYGAVAGAAIAVVVAVRRRSVIPLFLNAGQLTLSFVTFGRHGERRTLHSAGSSPSAIPYGVAIGIGAFAAWFT